MTNKTFYIFVAAAIALIAYTVWATVKLKEAKNANQHLQNNLVRAHSQNNSLVNSNLALANENQQYKDYLNNK